jgi:cell division protein FtsZ
MKGARGLLISITGGKDLTLFEVDEAATRIREEVDPDANIILGATFEESLEGVIRVSVVATGIDHAAREDTTPAEICMAELPAPPHRGQARGQAGAGGCRKAGPGAAHRRPGPDPGAEASPAAGLSRRGCRAGGRRGDITIAPYRPMATEYDGEFDVEAELRIAFESEQAVHTEALFIPPQAERPRSGC